MGGHGKRLALLLACAAVLAAAVIAGTSIARSNRAGAAALNIYGSGDYVQENRASYAASRLSGTNINRPAGQFDDRVFLTRLASRDSPDVVCITRPRVAEYASKASCGPWIH